jgi:ribosomal protein L11 methyltransferase
MPYLCRTFSLPAALSAEIEEAFIAELWEAGTLGVEHEGAVGGRQRLRAYFPAGSALAPDSIGAASLHSGAVPPSWAGQGVEMVGAEVVPETDWLAVYREQAQPFPVGRTFFVDPRDPLALDGGQAAAMEDAVPAGRTLLRVPARAAFGIGSHESTALAIDLLEGLDLRGARVLDVGTGTGILALAALRRGAASAVGFDLDLVAPFHARDNSRLNGCRLRLFAGRLAAFCLSTLFDVTLVNVVPEQILPELPDLGRHLAPAGAMILSGILAERAGEVLAAAGALGLRETARRSSGEWVAYRLAFVADAADEADVGVAADAADVGGAADVADAAGLPRAAGVP